MNLSLEQFLNSHRMVGENVQPPDHDQDDGEDGETAKRHAHPSVHGHLRAGDAVDLRQQQLRLTFDSDL
uniref:Uncharacterized protein n=1 Tax=Timema monikensis TaxID=170555 RepID=A0A7R9EFC1_9NEOP|nr:unnamed protein product [Timema monikensis]